MLIVCRVFSLLFLPFFCLAFCCRYSGCSVDKKKASLKEKEEEEAKNNVACGSTVTTFIRLKSGGQSVIWLISWICVASVALESPVSQFVPPRCFVSLLSPLYSSLSLSLLPLCISSAPSPSSSSSSPSPFFFSFFFFLPSMCPLSLRIHLRGRSGKWLLRLLASDSQWKLAKNFSHRAVLPRSRDTVQWLSRNGDDSIRLFQISQRPEVRRAHSRLLGNINGHVKVLQGWRAREKGRARGRGREHRDSRGKKERWKSVSLLLSLSQSKSFSRLFYSMSALQERKKRFEHKREPVIWYQSNGKVKLRTTALYSLAFSSSLRLSQSSACLPACTRCPALVRFAWAFDCQRRA